jgi:uncharacterized membrane protein YhdT
MKESLTKFVFTLLRCVYLVGWIISFAYFSWQYAQQSGFIRWLLFREIRPALQSTVWPYYVVKYLVDSDSSNQFAGWQFLGTKPSPDGKLIAAFKSRARWLPEYKQLNDALDRAGGTVSASYRVGPTGTSYVGVKLARGAGKGFIVTPDLPPEAINSVDPKTGKTESGEERSVWTYRDHNLDGMPDDVLVKPFQIPVFQESFRNDGYMAVRDSVDHKALLALWMTDVTLCTNHFLHSKDSNLP